MDSGTLHIGKIFGQDRRHVVPLFQRPYVWGRELQWEPLWGDIRTVADRVLEGKGGKPHFMGAIVLDQLRIPTGHMETRVVIDGQQRLTTVQLLLKAFADLCAAQKVDRYDKALLKLTRNEDPMSEDADEQFKVWPTNVDQEHFRRVMEAGSVADVQEFYGTPKNAGHPLAEGYLFFSEAVAEWLRCEEDGLGARVDALYRTLREQLRMVVIDLDEQDDAQVIFETLNARGTPLLPSDLVKNFLFHRAQMERQDIQVLYRKYWEPFDQGDGYWRKELGTGHARRARIDLFLHNHLMIQKRESVSVAHLYTTFREYASVEANGTSTQHLQKLRSYADVFKSMDEYPEDTREGQFFRRLDTIGVTSAHPFLMELVAKHGSDPEEVRGVLDIVESFLVRRMVCGLNTRGYNILFVDMLETLEGEGRVSERVRGYLLDMTAASNRWPDDAEFAQEWTIRPLYQSLARGRVRMLLEALEGGLRSGKTEKIHFADGLQIEHLMPQDWKKQWPLPADHDPVEAAAIREAMLHTMGNLTLVTEKLNPSISNGSWDTKRKEIGAHSALSLNRQVIEAPQWDEDGIRARCHSLFAQARTIWAHPRGGAGAVGLESGWNA
jgi:hypothetical protein